MLPMAITVYYVRNFIHLTINLDLLEEETIPSARTHTIMYARIQVGLHYNIMVQSAV